GLTNDYSIMGPDYAGRLQNGVNVGGPGAFNGSGAAIFDGIDDHILLPPVTPLAEDGSFTISAWLYAESGITDEAEAIGSHRGYFLNGFSLYYDNGELVFLTQTSSPSADAKTPFALDTWNHVVVTFENGVGAKLYLNGQLAD